MEFDSFLADINTRSGSILVCGDFNISMNDINSHYTCKFTELIGTYNLIQHVKGSTHKSGNILDLILTRESDSTIQGEPVILPDELSDHHVISFYIHGRCPQTAVERAYGRDFRGLDIEVLQSEIMEMTDDLAHSDLPLNEQYRRYSSILLKCLDNHAPVVTRRRTLKAARPWEDNTCHDLRREWRKAERMWRNSKLHVHLQIYLDRRDTVVHYLNEAKAA